MQISSGFGTSCQDKGMEKVNIKNRYNQAQHLTQDTEWESDKTQKTSHTRKPSGQPFLGERDTRTIFLKIITWTPKYTIDHSG